MSLLKLFLLMIVLGGAGGAMGSMVGNALGGERGGLIVGGILGGMLLVVAGGFLAARWRWIKPAERVWTILGGVLGFALACLVALSTLSSPIGPIVSTLLIGSGAVLGRVVGKDPHAEA